MEPTVVAGTTDPEGSFTPAPAPDRHRVVSARGGHHFAGAGHRAGFPDADRVKRVVAVERADIAAVDTAAAIAKQFRGRETIDASGQIVLPGLINTHTHAPMVLYRGLADDLALLRGQAVRSGFALWNSRRPGRSHGR